MIFQHKVALCDLQDHHLFMKNIITNKLFLQDVEELTLSTLVFIEELELSKDSLTEKGKV